MSGAASRAATAAALFVSRTARKANCDLDQSTRRFNSELQQDGIDGMAE
jgi:hypothetical protein